MTSMFIEGRNANGDKEYYFVEGDTLYKIKMEKISEGSIMISNPRPKVEGNLTPEKKAKAIEKLSPRVVVHTRNTVIDLNNFVPYNETPLLQCKY